MKGVLAAMMHGRTKLFSTDVLSKLFLVTSCVAAHDLRADERWQPIPTPDYQPDREPSTTEIMKRNKMIIDFIGTLVSCAALTEVRECHELFPSGAFKMA